MTFTENFVEKCHASTGAEGAVEVQYEGNAIVVADKDDDSMKKGLLFNKEFSYCLR